MSLLSEISRTVVNARFFTGDQPLTDSPLALPALAPSYIQRGQLVHPTSSIVDATSFPAFSYDGSTMVLPNILAGGVAQLLVYTQAPDKTYTVSSILPITTTNVYANDCTAAISYDGTVCAFSSQYDGVQSNGLIVVFRKKNGTWTQIFSDVGQVQDSLGFSLSMSADGSTIAVGAPGLASSGYVNVYSRRNDTVVLQQRISGQAAGVAPNGGYGMACCLSANGQTLAVGAPITDAGIVFMYARVSTGAWSSPTSLIPVGVTNAFLSPNIGTSVSLDYAGVTLAVGCVSAGLQRVNGTGCVVVYTFVAGGWAQGQTIIPFDIQPSPNPCYMGYTVTLAANGQTLSFDGYDDFGEQGGVWIFVRDSNDLWSANGIKRVGTGYTNAACQQFGGILSPDASVMAVMSAKYNVANEFAFWVFA